MPDNKSKKQLILEYFQERGFARVGAPEIRALEAELRRRLGAENKTPLSYIANVLRQAGAHVEFDGRYVDPRIEQPYAGRLQGLLRFGDFDETESAIQKLDALYREYREVSDRVGTSLVRTLVLKGKQRAESLATNSRVNPEKRREKQEISRWFKIWLDLPDLFFDWLELRKQSEEFQRLFSNHNGRGGEQRPSRKP